MKKIVTLLLALMMVVSMIPAAFAVEADPDFPSSGTLNVLVGWAAGGTTDLVARRVASDMSAVLGCNNSVQNVTGSSGAIAATQVATEGENGETVWGGMISAINTWRAMAYNDMSWKDWYSFIAVQTDFVLAVSKDSDFETYEDFVDYAAEHPGELSSGNPGLGSVGHLAAITFCQAFDIETNHVPYSGGRAAAIGVMGGEIDYLFIAYGDIYDLIESGDLKALACTGEEDKAVTMTDGTEITIPTLDKDHPEIAETTSQLGMWGVAIPRTTPAEQVLAFENAFVEATSSDEFKSYCESIGVKPVSISGEEADQTMAQGESTYVDILAGLELTAVSAEDLGIPAPADYSWDNVDMTDVPAWPAA